MAALSQDLRSETWKLPPDNEPDPQQAANLNRARRALTRAKTALNAQTR